MDSILWVILAKNSINNIFVFYKIIFEYCLIHIRFWKLTDDAWGTQVVEEFSVNRRMADKSSNLKFVEQLTSLSPANGWTKPRWIGAVRRLIFLSVFPSYFNLLIFSGNYTKRKDSHDITTKTFHRRSAPTGCLLHNHIDIPHFLST